MSIRGPESCHMPRKPWKSTTLFQKTTITARLENAESGHFNDRYPHLHPKNASGCTCAPRSFSGETSLFCLSKSGFRAKLVHPFSRFLGWSPQSPVSPVCGMSPTIDGRWKLVCNAALASEPPPFSGPIMAICGSESLIMPRKPLEIDDHFRKQQVQDALD